MILTIQSRKEYHRRLMSASAHVHIDALAFARRGETLEGVFQASSLPRVGAILAAPAYALQYGIYGHTESGRPVLRVSVRCQLMQTCQRCLEPFEWPLSLDVRLPVARDARELQRWEEQDAMLDALLADPRMDVVALVEDEVLLALPLAPKHPDTECRVGEIRQEGAQT